MATVRAILPGDEGLPMPGSIHTHDALQDHGHRLHHHHSGSPTHEPAQVVILLEDPFVRALLETTTCGGRFLVTLTPPLDGRQEQTTGGIHSPLYMSDVQRAREARRVTRMRRKHKNGNGNGKSGRPQRVGHGPKKTG